MSDGDRVMRKLKGLSRPSLLQPQELEAKDQGAGARGRGAGELWESSLEMETFLEKKPRECEKVSPV